MKKISLDGTWELTYFPEGKFSVKDPGELSGIKAKTVSAKVPGNVELDLARAGEIPDPFYGGNIFKLRPYEFYEWWYTRSFEVEDIDRVSFPHIHIAFDGIDCFSEIWLNNRKIGETDNMLIKHCFDVTDVVKKGKNEIAVRIRSAVNEARKYTYEPVEQALPVNHESLYVRKAAHMYGWDICPRVVSAGLWRSVDLEFRPPSEIKDMYYYTSSIDASNARLGIFWQFRTDEKSLEGFSLKISGESGESGEHRFERTIPLYFVTGWETIDVQNAKLWWPRGYGRQNLYEVKAELMKDGKVVDRRCDRVGLRTMELVRTDITTITNPGEFLFKCNGVPIMCKGSNWVPADAFHSRDASRYKKILELFDDLGCNILRSWGGSVYEDHAFYDICDEKGIMVWQDFSFACALYPQENEFLKRVEIEAESILRKLRNHPSIILWSGDNECDIFAFYRGIDPAKNRITREVLPRMVFKCDPFRPFLPSSPYFSPEVVKSKNGGLVPEDHLWGPRDCYKSRYYRESLAHFASEMGYHGCPNVSSIKKFIDREYLWPWKDNPQWRVHCTDPVEGGSSYSYRVKLMADQIKELFGEMPESLEEFALASQVSQAEAKKFFIEMFRIKKWRRTGIIWWNVMDCWPQFSDAIVDYYFSKKLAYWFIKRVQVPVCVMVDEPDDWNCRIVAGNDSLEPAEGKFSIRDADSGEALLKGNFEVGANV
ncbi:glycoside hydrolase family 2, partial [Candidatus Desantisbacteria bacterium CG_4_9_14_3_um_filter_50_7]